MRGVVSTQQKLKDTEHSIKMLRQTLAALTRDRDAAQEERQDVRAPPIPGVDPA
jgi:hypothetical protein